MPRVPQPMLVAQHGHIAAVAHIVQREARMQNNKEWTALMSAAFSGNLEAARLLIDHEAGMKITMVRALMIAARKGRTGIVGLLAQHEACITDDNEMTALMVAQSKGYQNIVDILACCGKE